MVAIVCNMQLFYLLVLAKLICIKVNKFLKIVFVNLTVLTLRIGVYSIWYGDNIWAKSIKD